MCLQNFEKNVSSFIVKRVTNQKIIIIEYGRKYFFVQANCVKGINN